MEKEKKQIYKKSWFWLIIIVVIVGLLGTNNTNNTNSTNSTNINNDVNENKPAILDTITLSYGNSDMNTYTVGKDFAAGKYKVILNNDSCNGNFIVYNNNLDYEILLNENMGKEYTTNITEIDLQEGNIIEVYKDLIVKLELIK